MIILPAIDIQDGTCVRLVKGDFATSHKVAEDYRKTAAGFVAAGASWIHMVDLDGTVPRIRSFHHKPLPESVRHRSHTLPDIPVQRLPDKNERNKHMLLHPNCAAMGNQSDIPACSSPMLMDTGGNCGSQASATIIRGISLQQIKFSDIFRVVWKETRVALLCGLTLAAVNFVKLILLSKVTVTVAAVICLTLVFTVFVAKIVGCTLPILAKRVGGDPAVMASPFLTTIVDALSLIIYFEIAGVLLHI